MRGTMSAILRILGLEPTSAAKAQHAESREAFEAQLRERSVTDASRLNAVAAKRLGRTLSKTRSLSVEIERDLSGRDRHGHAD